MQRGEEKVTNFLMKHKIPKTKKYQSKTLNSEFEGGTKLSKIDKTKCKETPTLDYNFKPLFQREKR